MERSNGRGDRPEGGQVEAVHTFDFLDTLWYGFYRYSGIDQETAMFQLNLGSARGFLTLEREVLEVMGYVVQWSLEHPFLLDTERIAQAVADTIHEL